MKIPHRFQSRPGPRGFTLIEILAAVTVLALLLVIFTQVIGMVSDTWKKGKARIDNYAQARVALGLMDRDIQSMVIRRDVAAFVGASKDASGNPTPAFAFYTRMSGSESNRDRRLSLVQYSIADPSTQPRLTRKDYGLDLGTVTPGRTVQFNETAMLPDLVATQIQVQDVADGVVGFEFQFVDANGALQSEFKYDYAHPSAVTNTRTVTVSLAVLDSESYRFAEKSGALATILQGLDGVPTGTQTYADYWRAQMALPGFMPSLPQPVRSSIRIFERSIYIPMDTMGS